MACLPFPSLNFHVRVLLSNTHKKPFDPFPFNPFPSPLQVPAISSMMCIN